MSIVKIVNKTEMQKRLKTAQEFLKTLKAINTNVGSIKLRDIAKEHGFDLSYKERRCSFSRQTLAISQTGTIDPSTTRYLYLYDFSIEGIYTALCETIQWMKCEIKQANNKSYGCEYNLRHTVMCEFLDREMTKREFVAMKKQIAGELRALAAQLDTWDGTKPLEALE